VNVKKKTATNTDHKKGGKRDLENKKKHNRGKKGRVNQERAKRAWVNHVQRETDTGGIKLGPKKNTSEREKKNGGTP